MEKSSVLSKPTFQAVVSSQDTLRHLLDKLISEDRPIASVEEREEFLSLLKHSTFGLGVDRKFHIAGHKGYHRIGNVEYAARWLAYCDTNNPMVGAERILIKDLWVHLRNQLFKVYPVALTVAIRMSAEKSLPFGDDAADLEAV